MRYKQGIFKPRNPEKWVNPEKIVFRSGLEARFFRFIDLNKGIIRAASEELYIPYRSPVDQKMHRYFVDLIIQTENKKVYVVEIKPFSQTTPPKQRKNTKYYLNECKTYAVNEAKWKAAIEFCKERGMEFMILTEKDLKNA